MKELNLTSMELPTGLPVFDLTDTERTVRIGATEGNGVFLSVAGADLDGGKGIACLDFTLVESKVVLGMLKTIVESVDERIQRGGAR